MQWGGGGEILGSFSSRAQPYLDLQVIFDFKRCSSASRGRGKVLQDDEMGASPSPRRSPTGGQRSGLLAKAPAATRRGEQGQPHTSPTATGCKPDYHGLWVYFQASKVENTPAFSVSRSGTRRIFTSSETDDEFPSAFPILFPLPLTRSLSLRREDDAHGASLPGQDRDTPPQPSPCPPLPRGRAGGAGNQSGRDRKFQVSTSSRGR